MSARPAAIEALAARPATAGLICDFDGVLSPIVADPTTSAMSPQVASALGRLARCLGLVAVISGRPLAFLRERVPVAGIPLLGSYGIEQFRQGEAYMAPEAREWLHKVRGASEQLREHFANWPGVRIEEKAVSVAVHWRQAHDQDAASAEIRRVTAGIGAATGLRAEPGKLVSELRPPIDVDKGSAIAALLAEGKPEVIAYAGDDLGDIPALRAVREAGGYALVVDHGAETDLRLLRLADESFHGTEAFGRWLTELADAAEFRVSGSSAGSLARTCPVLPPRRLATAAGGGRSRPRSGWAGSPSRRGGRGCRPSRPAWASIRPPSGCCWPG
jgi:trehalose 6-phosphate phosphatase